MYDNLIVNTNTEEQFCRVFGVIIKITPKMYYCFRIRLLVIPSEVLTSKA